MVGAWGMCTAFGMEIKHGMIISVPGAEIPTRLKLIGDVVKFYESFIVNGSMQTF